MKTKFSLLLISGLLAFSFPTGVRAQAGTLQPDPQHTPAPGPTPAALPTGTPTPMVVPPSVTTQIFKVVFSAETLTEAIAQALAETSRQEVESLSSESSQLASILGSIVQPSDDGHFAAAGSAGLPTAAALAPVLFLLRLALHHWQRLLGETEGLLEVLGDWAFAGFTAALAGHFLDLLVQAGWWAAGAALGETAGLARDFLSVANVPGLLGAVPLLGRPSMFSALFAIAAGLGGLLGVAGLGFAFAAAQAVLFVLAATAPVLMVLAVLPQMRWMRGLWLKAVCVLALIPVAAGGVFKAAVVLAASFGGDGIGQLLIRLLWLWGAVGFLLSMAGILGRVTISAAVGGAARLAGGVRSMVVLGMHAIGSGAGAGVAAGVAGTGTAVQTLAGGLPGGQSGSLTTGAQDAVLNSHFVSAGLDPRWAQSSFPEETRRMTAMYRADPDGIDSAPEPLREAARRAEASGFLAWLDAEEPG